MNSVITSRRSLLKAMGIAGGGLVLGLPLSGCSSKAAPFPYTDSASFQPNAFLQITPDNTITFFLPRVEMGQGTTMGLATLVAEELEIDPADLKIRHAGVHKDYALPGMFMQATGGSASIATSYYPLRQVAATAREMLRSAAAQKLGAAAADLQFRAGQIHWNGQSHDYGEFAALAASQPLPEDVAVKEPDDFRLIGKDRGPRIDALAKVTGTAEFGMDVDFPGLYRTALLRCAVIGGTVKSVNSDDAGKMPGVKKIVSIFNGVAVIADSYWQARNALAALQVEWNLPPLSQQSSDGIYAELKAALAAEEAEEASKEGTGAAALLLAEKTLEADYYAPYLAHATMEPMNCTVKIAGDTMDVWAPTQAPDLAQAIAAEYSGIASENIAVHTTFLGGGFGRRTYHDFVAEAVSIAKASGMPVQLVWSREDDMQNGYFRPVSMSRFAAGLDSQGKLQSWTVRRAGPNMVAHTMDEVVSALMKPALPDAMADWLSKRGYSVFDGWVVDPSSVEGLAEDYQVPNKEVQHVTLEPGLRLGAWRSVGASFSGFFKESFMDEMAHAANQDPLLFRLQHTENNPRLSKVIETAARAANWGQPLLPGRYLGIAAHFSFKTYVAEVAEVSVENGVIRVHKVTCAVDCGRVINPDIVRAQMESGIIYGMSAALYGEITLRNGAVEQSNFHDYPVLRMTESPAIDVHIIASDEDPTGVGEPGLPPIAAAIGNAVFAATGQRLRELPFKLKA